GFTLIEMVVLIIIIAVVSSVVVPSYVRFHSRAKFQHSVENVVFTLNWARSSAIQNSADTVVRFDAQSQTISVVADTPSVPSDLPTAIQESPEPVSIPEPKMVQLGEDVMVRDFTVANDVSSATTNTDPTTANQSRELRFYENGSSNGGTLILQSAENYLAR